MPQFFPPDTGRRILSALLVAFPWAGTEHGYDNYLGLFNAINDRLSLGMEPQERDHVGVNKSATSTLVGELDDIPWNQQPEGAEFWLHHKSHVRDIHRVVDNGYLDGNAAKGIRKSLEEGADPGRLKSKVYGESPFDSDQSLFIVCYLQHLIAVETAGPAKPAAEAPAPTLDLVGLIRAAVVHGMVSKAELPALVREHAQVAVSAIEVTITDGPTVALEAGPYHKVFPTVLQCVAARCNVALVGPAGSGKTTLAHQAAVALGLPFYFTGAIQSEYKLLGFVDATSGYRPTAFRQAYEGGGVFLFDEIDASAPQTLLAFNAALANGECDFPDGTVKRHPNFVAIAAANTFWNGRDRVYVGRNQLDAATMDRFAFLEMDYDEALERAVATNPTWVDYVQAARKGARELQIRHVISPRASISGSNLLAQGIDGAAVATMTLWKGLPEAEVKKIAAKMPGKGELPASLRRTQPLPAPEPLGARAVRRGVNLLDAMGGRAA